MVDELEIHIPVFILIKEKEKIFLYCIGSISLLLWFY
jgi:hypothetical protein